MRALCPHHSAPRGGVPAICVCICVIRFAFRAVISRAGHYEAKRLRVLDPKKPTFNDALDTPLPLCVRDDGYLVFVLGALCGVDKSKIMLAPNPC